MTSLSLFLEAPREIRDQIYSYALGPESRYIEPAEDFRLPFGKDFVTPVFHTRFEITYTVTFPELEPRLEIPFTIPGVTLLRTSKQIHEEAAPFLYSTNTFSLAFKAGSFLRDIGAINSSLIRHLILPLRDAELLAPHPHLDALPRIGVNSPRPASDHTYTHAKQARRAIEHIIDLCKGVQVLELEAGPARHVQGYPFSTARVMDAVCSIDRARDGLRELKRTILVVDGKREDLWTPECLALLRLASSFEWEVRRVRRRFATVRHDDLGLSTRCFLDGNEVEDNFKIRFWQPDPDTGFD